MTVRVFISQLERKTELERMRMRKNENEKERMN